MGSDLLTNLAGAALSGAGNKGHAEGTTQAAVSGGSVVIRDQANQKQDVNQLSRDTENANGSIGPIFDKEKEQNRLKQAQLIGEIAGQTMDVIRTQGDINGLKAAKAANPTEKDVKVLRNSDAYKKAMESYGTGSDMQRAAQAVTGALQALAGNNLAGALASGTAPYLAREIKARIGDDNVAANAMAHAVLGAIAAQLNNQSAVAGAVGAGGGELVARVILSEMFQGRKISELTESEKQQVSALSQLAAGLAGGLVSDSTAGIVTGSQAAKNAVENNFLSVPAPVPPPVAVSNTSVNGTGGNEAWDADDGSDPNKSREENARKPNVAKDLTDEDKAELGGAGSGTPGGHGPEDEENARSKESQSQSGDIPKSGEKLSWDSWQNYPKKTVDGRQYAEVGNRLYSQHAVDRMQPSGLGSPAGTGGPGRNITPNMVEHTIKTGTAETSVSNGVSRTVYWSGDVGVVTENNANVVVTILRRSGQ